MRNIIFVLTLIILTSCKNYNRDSRIEKFENFLGFDNSELLSRKVESFEQFLRINFKDLSLNNAYFEYLKKIESGEFKNSDWEYEGTGQAEINESIEKSGLRREIWLRPDTVWIENGDIHYEYYYIDNKDTRFIKGNTLSPEYDLIENQDS